MFKIFLLLNAVLKMIALQVLCATVYGSDIFNICDKSTTSFLTTLFHKNAVCSIVQFSTVNGTCTVECCTELCMQTKKKYSVVLVEEPPHATQ